MFKFDYTVIKLGNRTYNINKTGKLILYTEENIEIDFLDF